MTAVGAGQARAAVFLDRDGVLSELVERDGMRTSPRRAAEFRLVPEAAESVDRLRATGFLVFVVTNQPDVARGHLPAEELRRMTGILSAALAVHEVVVCPHDDADHCECRKPQPGMLISLARRWGVELARSYVVGDTSKDVEAGRRAGCRTILVGAGAGGAADRVVASLGEAVEFIEAELALRREGTDGVHA